MGLLYCVSWRALTPLLRPAPTAGRQRLQTHPAGGWQLTASTSMPWQRWGSQGSPQGTSERVQASLASAASAGLTVLQRMQVLSVPAFLV